jgi:RNA polymerase sigma factor (sigma-70 family)
MSTSELPSPFAHLIQRARQGSAAAARELVETYGPAVERVIRRRLRHDLRRLLDPEDILQQVWLEFFSKGLHQATFEGPDKLVAFLRRLAVRQVAMAHRAFWHGHQHHLEQLLSLDDPGAAAAGWVSRAPPPEQEVDQDDAFARLWPRLSWEEHQVFRWLFLGHTYRRIADHLGVSTRTVQRLAAHLLNELRCTAR